MYPLSILSFLCFMIRNERTILLCFFIGELFFRQLFTLHLLLLTTLIINDL